MLWKRVNCVQDVLPGWKFCVQSFLFVHWNSQNQKNLKTLEKPSVVTKALVVETEAKAEAVASETEAEAKAVYLETETEAQGSWLILLAVPITTCN